MRFSTAQQQVIRNYILTTPELAIVAPGEDGSEFIKTYLNQIQTPEVLLWDSRGDVRKVFDSINWNRFTPNWTIASNETQIPLLAKQGWNGLINIKQMNLQNMLIRMETIDATRANIRAGLADSLRNLPSGNISANVPAPQDAGAIPVLESLRRPARIIENLLLTEVAQTTLGVSAFVPIFEGEITRQEVSQIRET